MVFEVFSFYGGRSATFLCHAGRKTKKYVENPVLCFIVSD